MINSSTPIAQNHPSHRRSRSIGIAAALITITIWTSFIVIARASAAHWLTPLDLVFARLTGASIILLPWGWFITQRMRRAAMANTLQTKDSKPYSLWGLSPLPLAPTLALGLFGGMLYAPLAYTAFFYAPAAHGAVLMPGMLPLSTAIFAAFILGESFTRQRLLGLALVGCGGLLVGGASLLRAFEGGQVWVGDLLFLSASSCWAMYSVLARRWRVEAVHATIAITSFATLCFVPLYGLLAWANALPFGLVSHLTQASSGEIFFQMLNQGIGSVVISGITFTLMLKHFGAVRTTMLTALVPSLASLAAVVFLNEPIYWNLIAGLVLALSGVALGVVQRAAPSAKR